MSKILLVGSQHGNEPLGFQLYAYIRIHHPDLLKCCELVVANPLAAQLGRRYVESDMNRSFAVMTSSYESRQADRLLELIDKNKPDLVLDLHTTTCKQPPSLIISSNVRHCREFIAASSISKIVIMPQTITLHSLIGSCPMAISVEISDDDLHTKTYESLVADIRRYLSNEPIKIVRSVYKITGRLSKHSMSSKSISKLRNFEMTQAGFAPYLVGKNNSYVKQTDYLGFKAVPTDEYEL